MTKPLKALSFKRFTLAGLKRRCQTLEGYVGGFRNELEGYRDRGQDYANRMEVREAIDNINRATKCLKQAELAFDKLAKNG